MYCRQKNTKNDYTQHPYACYCGINHWEKQRLIRQQASVVSNVEINTEQWWRQRKDQNVNQSVSSSFCL